MEQGPIDHNLKFVCETTQPDWIKVSTQITHDQREDKQVPHCIVSARKKYPEDQVKSIKKECLKMKYSLKNEDGFSKQIYVIDSSACNS